MSEKHTIRNGIIVGVVVGIILFFLNAFSPAIWSVTKIVFSWFWDLAWVRVPIPLWTFLIFIWLFFKLFAKAIRQQNRINISMDMPPNIESQFDDVHRTIIKILVIKDGDVIDINELKSKTRMSTLMLTSALTDLIKLGLIIKTKDRLGGTLFVFTNGGLKWAKEHGYLDIMR